MKNEIKVMYHNICVGTLAETKEHMVAFEYDDDWLKNGFSISPFSLPLKKGVFIPKNNYFNGLFGVFSDSLPDSWGRLLIKRKLAKDGINDSSEFFKLTVVNDLSMGALMYLPSIDYKNELKDDIDFDKLSKECQEMLDNKECENLDLLFRQGGSSGGARPKINVKLDNHIYLVKFFTKMDGSIAGIREYDYSLCAKKCNINMPSTKLLKSNICDGFFAIERFDRKESKKIHMVSAAALLEYDFNSPAMDYHTLMKLTKILTNNNKIDMMELFRRMCFNVYSHNLDDHGKNFSYLYDEDNHSWRLSPAYDLTYSETYYGEHTTSVNGKGKAIEDSDLMEVGIKAGLKKNELTKELELIKANVSNDLSKYLK